MLASSTIGLNIQLRRVIPHLVLLLTFALAFVATIDGPSANFSMEAGSVGYKTAKAINGVQGGVKLMPLWFGTPPEQSSPIHVSFLLFDIKQNLRRWPNIANDISRSPPLYLAL